MKAMLGLAAAACMACSTTPASSVRVELKAVAFEPELLQVTAGTTVAWVNADDFEHTVTGGTPGHEAHVFSSRLAGGATFEHTFGQPGEFPYFCRIHPQNMTGRIRVQPSTTTGGRTA